MKRALWIIAFILAANICTAYDFKVEGRELRLLLKAESSAEIKPEASSYELDYLKVNVTFIPRNNSNQEVKEMVARPEPVRGDSAYEFEWERPRDNVSFGYDAIITTRYYLPEIGKVAYPASADDSLRRYIVPSATIDSDNMAVRRLANELSYGESDMYRVVYKFADWVNSNIYYNMSSLTMSATQKASWVLENKQGVCDELTALFIAMCRAEGIAARFVAGVAYTNSELFEEDWGAHGWAEVFFPGYGWVPFDVTYGEYGYIDAGHIKLKDSVDASESSAKYRWRGSNVAIVTKPLDFDVSVDKAVGRVPYEIEITARALYNKVGFGSYNIIEAEITNNNKYYVADELYLSKSSEVRIIGKERQSILLEPESSQKLKWIVRVDDDLRKGYEYQFPFEVISLRNETSRAVFRASNGERIYGFRSVSSIADSEKSELEKEYSDDIGFECTADKDTAYVYESIRVECAVENKGAKDIEALKVCIEKECSMIDLKEGREEKVYFDIKNPAAGRYLIGKAGNSEISKISYIDTEVLDIPMVSIEELSYPAEVKFDDDFEIEFVVDSSSSEPRDVVVELNNNYIKNSWKIEEGKRNRLKISLKGNDLVSSVNHFEVIVRYKDRKNREYMTNEEFVIRLEDISIMQRAYLLAKKAAYWVNGLW